MRTWPAFVLAALAMAAWGDQAVAASSPRTERSAASPISDRFYMRGTYFAPSVDTELRLDSANGTPGTPLSAEEDFGFDDRVDQGRIELMFRLRERSRLRVDYFKLDRFGDQILARTIDFGDETFSANERATTSLDWRMLNFAYAYSVIRRERFELGLGMGAHLIEAEAIGEIRARGQREDESGVVALPTFALDGAWRVSSRVALTGRAQYLRANVEDVSGSLADYHLDVQYRWTPNFAVGIGYTILRARFDIRDPDFPGRLALYARGPEMFLRVSF